MTDSPTTIPALLDYQAINIGNRVYLRFNDQSVTFDELNRQTNRVANALAGLNVQVGTGVSIMMQNSPEFLYTHFGVQKAGAYSVPINIGLKGEGLAHIINHSDSKVLVIDDEFIEAIVAISDDLKGLEQIIVNSSEGKEVQSGWNSLAQLADASAEFSPGVAPPIGEISTLLYTSGTTGLPKGVIRRCQELAYFDDPVAQWFNDFDVMYTCLPLFHANALEISAMGALVTGNTLALARRFSASRHWDDIRRYDAKIFNALGAMIPILMKQPELPGDADNPAKVVISAACPTSVWEAFERRFCVKIIEGYGAVDAGEFGSRNAGNAPVGSIGRPETPHQLVDDDGVEVSVGEVGELRFKVEKDATVVEYYKNEEATRNKVVDGWLYTGDLMHADEDGFLFFDDRKTDSLRRRGENISAWEVEREINKHEAVLESAVVGVNSELGEYDVMSFVVLKPQMSLTPEQLIRHCEPLMAEFMLPRYIEFLDEFEKTGTHRIKKSTLKRRGIGPNTWDRECCVVN